MIVGVSDKVLMPWLEGKEYLDATDEGEAIAIAAGYSIQTGEPGTAFMSADGFFNALNFITSWIIPKGIPLNVVISIGREEPSHFVATEMVPIIVDKLKEYETARISYEFVRKQ